MECSELQALLDRAKKKTIAVIGDIMLDRYFVGSVTRISPEAPVPVVNLESEYERFGGAANVAYNLANLGVQAMAFGIIGMDEAGDRFLKRSDQSGIDQSGIIRLPHRQTTTKTRVIGANQHLVRIDREDTSAINTHTCNELIDRLRSHIDRLDGIILEDYNKGLITPELIAQTMDIAKKHGIPVYVDPKFNHFFDYQDITLFKPNIREAETALSMTLTTMDDFHEAARILRQRTHAENVLVTLGSQGMLLHDKSGFHHYSTTVKNLADVSGAGDTVIATLSAAHIAGAPLATAVTLANLAAAAVVAEVGIVSITGDRLLQCLDEQHCD